MKTTRMLWTVGTLLAIGWPVGCETGEKPGSSGGGFAQGVNVPRGATDHTDQRRVEFEFIPNAKLVRENTKPEWEHGRAAFDRGIDRLLVITQTTSVARRDGRLSERYDVYVEQVWIQIPLDVQVREEVDLGELEEKFMVVYDRGDAGHPLYRQPATVKGTLVLLDESDEQVHMTMDMQVTPADMPAWKVRGDLDVPVYPEGNEAKKVSKKYKPYEFDAPYVPGLDVGPSEDPQEQPQDSPPADDGKGVPPGQSISEDD